MTFRINDQILQFNFTILKKKTSNSVYRVNGPFNVNSGKSSLKSRPLWGTLFIHFTTFHNDELNFDGKNMFLNDSFIKEFKTAG